MPRKIMLIESKQASLLHYHQRVVFTNGCFDLLHVGHVRLLEYAKRLGDVLIVGINSDDSVRRLKGPDRPWVPEQERVILVDSLRCVDYTILFDQPTPRDLIFDIQPQVLVKGGDYIGQEIVGASEVREWGGEVKFFPTMANHSTTITVQRIKESK